MIILRKASDRGFADHGWLKSYHSFSFGHYYDRHQMGFGPLRVINEDWIAPDNGFGTHPHDNMEIVTYVLSGSLTHQDSMKNGSIIHPGEVQRMTAGTGVTHSEFNHSLEKEVHLLQIWILPNQQNLPPSYEQTFFSLEQKQGQFCLVASPDGRQGSVTVHQDVQLSVALLEAESVVVPFSPKRLGWVQVAAGSIEVNGVFLTAGDGVAIQQESELRFAQGDKAEVLLFDMAS